MSVGSNATAWDLLDRLVNGSKPSCCLLGLWHCIEMIFTCRVYDAAGVFTSIESDLVDASEPANQRLPSKPSSPTFKIDEALSTLVHI
jgi:hypothetical protein